MSCLDLLKSTLARIIESTPPLLQSNIWLENQLKKGAVPKPVSALAVFRRHRCLPYEKL